MKQLEQAFSYQLEGAKFLASKEQALLADAMGLGKSAQAVIGCDIVEAVNVLIVCPAAVRINWEREFRRFSPLDRAIKVIGSGKDSHITGVNIISYDLIASNSKLKQALKDMNWDVLVLDEAHYCKERSAKRTRAIYGSHANQKGVIHSSKRCWRLTGTPIPNNASELYTHLKSAGIYTRPYWDFVYDFCKGFDSDYGYKITGHKNTNKLKELLGKFMLRRKTEDVMKELPPIVFQNITVERSPVDLDPYFYENWKPIGIPQFLAEMADRDAVLRSAIHTINKADKHTLEDTVNLLDTFSKSTSTLRRYIGMAKLPKVLEILTGDLESKEVEKLVIFAIHKDVIETARTKLRKYGAVTLYGGTPPARRQENIDKFQNDPKCRVFIGNIRAAGVGITLTRSHDIAFVESDWVPGNNAQAAMRCHRIGQTKPVRVRFFTCADSVDEEVNRALLHKTREIVKIID